ncbi:hypothetical protein ABW19_dt0209751 [Dactylella cylindrospora]|nr:hypothetical protein ABW19_dt0209751 [Dactylella cylindrospora]
MRFFSTLSPQKVFLTALLFSIAQGLPAPKAVNEPVLSPAIPADAEVDAEELAARDELEKRSTQGGQLNLVNGTPYKWKITSYDEYQITGSWKGGFAGNPEVASLGGSFRIHIEFDTSMFVTESDTNGYATYQMEGCMGSDGNICQFTMLARGFGHGTSKFEISARLDNIAALGYGVGSVIDLGWTHDHDCAFVLSGDTTQGFGTTRPPTNWMQMNLPTIGTRKLKDISMPGSHDSGMSTVTSSTLLAFEGNTLTQWHSIYDQLMYGARYFDIRPVVSSGEFRLGHYSHIMDNSWQGMSGQRLADVIVQINDFTEDYGELVILNLSHDLLTDIGNDNYQSFDQGWWDSLLNTLSNPDTGLKRIYITDQDPATVNLMTEPLNKFIGSGQGAVLIICDPGRGIGTNDGQINIDAFRSKGFYARSQYDPIDSYTGSKDLEAVVTDQINKMNARDVNRPFLLSWTITLSDWQDNIPGLASLRDTADEMNDLLWSRLTPAVNANTWPSILYIDSMGGKDGNAKNNYAALAMAINYIARPTA